MKLEIPPEFEIPQNAKLKPIEIARGLGLSEEDIDEDDRITGLR